MDIKIPEESVTGLVYKANECSFVLVFVMLSQIWFLFEIVTMQQQIETLFNATTKLFCKWL